MDFQAGVVSTLGTLKSLLTAIPPGNFRNCKNEAKSFSSGQSIDTLMIAYRKKKAENWDFPVVQAGNHFPYRLQVQSQVRQLRSYMPQGN